MWNSSASLPQGKVSEPSFTDGYTRKFLGILDPTHYGICDVSVGSSLLIVASTHLFVTLTFVSLLVLTVVLLPSPLLIVFGCIVVVAWIVCTVYSYLSYRDGGSSNGRLVIHVLYPTSAGLTISSFLAVGIVFAASTQVFLLGITPQNLQSMGYLNGNDIAALLYYRAAAANNVHARSVWDFFWFLDAHFPLKSNINSRVTIIDDMRLISDALQALGFIDMPGASLEADQPLDSTTDPFAPISTVALLPNPRGPLDVNRLTENNATYTQAGSINTSISETLLPFLSARKETNTSSELTPVVQKRPGYTTPPSSSSEIPTGPTTEAVQSENGDAPQLELKVTVPTDINKSEETSTTTSSPPVSKRRELWIALPIPKITNIHFSQFNTQPPLSNPKTSYSNSVERRQLSTDLRAHDFASDVIDILLTPEATMSPPTLLSSNTTKTALKNATTLKIVPLQIPPRLDELLQNDWSATSTPAADERKKHPDYKALYRLLSIRSTLLTLQFRLGTGLLITGVLLIPTALIWGWFIWSAIYRAIVVAREKQMSVLLYEGV